MKEKKKIIPWKMGRRGWHSKKWKVKKRELRRDMRKMKKEKISKEEYIRKKKEYKVWYEEEREKHEREEEERIKLIGSEKEVWKYINKFRKRRERIDENIELKEWKKHFIELLGGTEKRIIWEEKKEKREERKEEKEMANKEEITKEELAEQLRELKKGKAPGENEIENEAWRLMLEEIGEVLWKSINRIWKEGGIPNDWNRGLISPIYKKGDKTEVKNYRGVTLMDTAYKVYANILNEKLQREVDGKLEENQFGFRKGRGTTDATYVLNYLQGNLANLKILILLGPDPLAVTCQRVDADR
ncbi:UPF0329 protein ECU05_1680/ECU11_0050-like [Monomorium pharaonis]|uniref:UPF0329 protein ECU05_1680/ECU11_0050-like n=1 Tax=Monomorium pharaonis TaxID=307658 RepID=UPI0017469A50|nr:UPF0329 protein ECU05_1680/ECU11_0050-like [Monomorium pharaonis]